MELKDFVGLSIRNDFNFIYNEIENSSKQQWLPVRISKAIQGYQGYDMVYQLPLCVNTTKIGPNSLTCLPNFRPTVPYAAETRSMWWERCREMTQGFHRLLLVGPKESGKTTLIQIMAGLNGK